MPNFGRAQPLVLIGSDNSHLLVQREPVHLGPYGAPIAVHTSLGWAVQGPVSALLPSISFSPQMLFMLCNTVSCPATAELMENVERLWRMDSFPHQKEKEVTRSKQDQYSLDLLEEKTTVTEQGGVSCYATPLLRMPNSPHFTSSVRALLPMLRGTEHQLKRDPELAEV